MKSPLAFFFTLVAAAAPPPTDAAADFALARWEALHARFSPAMKAAATVDKLRAVAAPLGRCQAPAEPPSPGKTQPGFEAHVYRLVCANKTIGLSLTKDPQGVIHGLSFVEPPAPPDALAVVSGPYRLPAKITLPSGNGPFPAVVLVHGSGPHDMDETIGPNKPFRDIADGLAERGIASIRYTKRTKQYAGQLGSNITLHQETIEDAISAANLLRATPGIDPKRVFILGHSLGGYAAPRIGQADPSLAGLILLAGYTRPFDVLIDEQFQYLGAPPAKAEEFKKQIPAAYRQEVSADPVPVAKSLSMPMLILQGERDYQVTMDDFRRWQALRSPRVTLKSYPAMNHLFQPGQGKSKPGEYNLAAPFSPVVLDDIAAWIKR